MSSDPHPPTPPGSDPDETTEFRPPTAADPFAASGDRDALADEPTGGSEAVDRADSSDPGFEPPAERDASLEEPVSGDAATDPGAASIDPPPSTAELSEESFADPATDPSSGSPATLPPVAAPDVPADAPASEDDWLGPDAGASAATSEPDPVVRTPSSFTPLGTPEPSPKSQLQELTDRPEVMVALAFVGGALVSFVLKRFGR